tara:strand:- start:295 stop:492 length:198 start_codon:yes stop_codon:yes gene_type:complete
MAEPTTTEAQTTNEVREMTVVEYFQYVANLPDGHIFLPYQPKITLTDLEAYKNLHLVSGAMNPNG